MTKRKPLSIIIYGILIFLMAFAALGIAQIFLPTDYSPGSRPDHTFTYFMFALAVIFVLTGSAFIFWGLVLFVRSPNRKNGLGTVFSVPVSGSAKVVFTTEQELQKAADMLKSGLIDEAEYKALKARIISKS